MFAILRTLASAAGLALLSGCGSDSSPATAVSPASTPVAAPAPTPGPAPEPEAAVANVTASNEELSGLRGKLLYLDGGRLVGTGVSCVDCHGDVVGSAFALGKAANNPAAIEYAINAVPQMARSRGRYTARDMQDLSTYIGNPAVPSPDLRLQTSGAAANPFTAERLDFGPQNQGSSTAASTVRLNNVGRLALRVQDDPILGGPDASLFELVYSDCRRELVLQWQQGCDVAVRFRANGPAGLRTASISIAHDWIRGGVSIALIGTVVANQTGTTP